jgi:hypothetical protein
VQESSPTRADRAFIAFYFGSHKLPAGICYLLRGAEMAIQSAVVGTWLGLLTPARLRLLDAWYYNQGFGMYREKDYNRSGFFRWEQAVVDTYFAKVSSVLIPAGAGGGREALALNKLGLRVDGYEYNPALVKLGNELLTEDGYPATLQAGPADALPPGSQQYDGAILGWATYSLIPGRANRIALLKQIRARCPEGAPLLLSFFYRPRNTAAYRMTARTANAVRTLLRRPKVEMGDTLSVTWAHYFTEQEINDELIAGGFRPVLFNKEPYAHAVGLACEAGTSACPR